MIFAQYSVLTKKLTFFKDNHQTEYSLLTELTMLLNKIA